MHASQISLPYLANLAEATSRGFESLHGPSDSLAELVHELADMFAVASKTTAKHKTPATALAAALMAGGKVSERSMDALAWQLRRVALQLEHVDLDVLAKEEEDEEDETPTVSFDDLELDDLLREATREDATMTPDLWESFMFSFKRLEDALDSSSDKVLLDKFRGLCAWLQAGRWVSNEDLAALEGRADEWTVELTTGTVPCVADDADELELCLAPTCMVEPGADVEPIRTATDLVPSGWRLVRRAFGAYLERADGLARMDPLDADGCSFAGFTRASKTDAFVKLRSATGDMQAVAAACGRKVRFTP